MNMQTASGRDAVPVLPGHLFGSHPSSLSIDSIRSAESVSTPGSWTGVASSKNGTPETSPPSSRAESPARKETTPGTEDASSDSLPTAKSICFVGAGFVGGPTAAVIAYHNPQIRVNVVDLNEQRIAAWNSRHLPIHERGLLNVVRTARDGTQEVGLRLPGLGPLKLEARQPNLWFSTDVAQAIAEADIVFICVNTPTKTYGLGAGSMADVSAVEGATRTVGRHAKEGAVIVEKSTVPCGTARMIQDILRSERPETAFEVLSNPEFLAEGSAVENLMQPDRILIGSAQTLPGMRAAASLQAVYASWVPPSRILTVNTFSSELSKLVANAMLAQRVSSINAVSAMCEELGLGADVDDVSVAIGADTRLGPKFLQAGVGFGGSCFEKDILSLAYLARELHLEPVADYWLGVLRINEYQRQRFATRVVKQLSGTLRGKKIAVLGFAFKADTNDTRNSIAVHVIRDLAAEMPAEIAIFDPGCATDEIVDEIRSAGLSDAQLARIRVCEGWREVVTGSCAVCVLTQWKQFRGCEVEPPRKRTSKAQQAVQHSSVASFKGHKPDAMEIRALEKALSEAGSAQDDPLERLKTLPACVEGCKDCLHDPITPMSDEMVDWVEAFSMMGEPKYVFDGRNIVDSQHLSGLGFKVLGTGKSPLLG